MRTLCSVRFAALYLVLWIPMQWAGADPPRGPDTWQGTLGTDYYATGSRVEPPGAVPGDLFAAGGAVTVTQPVNGDAALAGGHIRVVGNIGEDLYAAGGNILIDGAVTGNARLAGGHIQLSPQARIQGRVTLAGGEIDIGAQVGEYVRAAAGHVRFNGSAQGDVHLTARDVEIGPAAIIHGRLLYRSARPARIDPLARITGGVQRIAIASYTERAAQVGRVVAAIAYVLGLLGLVLAGTLLILAFPRFMDAAARTLGTRPVASLVLGFALLITLPVAGILLMITLIGIPIGLLLFLLYPLALVLGYLLGAYSIGAYGVARWRPAGAGARRTHVIALLATLVALAFIGMIPFIGGFILFAVLIAGLGAFTLHAYHLYGTTRKAPAGHI